MGLSIEWIDRALIAPNHYNPNEMTPAQLRATAESLAEFGFRTPIMAATRPAGEGEGVVIIDGEHRWLASGFVYLMPADPFDPADDHLRPVATAEQAAALNAARAKGAPVVRAGDPLPVVAPADAGDPGIPHGFRRVYVPTEQDVPLTAVRAFPYLPVVRSDDLSEAQRKKLTIVMDQTRGDMDLVRLGGLLAELKGELGIDALAHALPFPAAELEQMTTLGAHDWDQYQTGSDGEGSGSGEGSGTEGSAASGWRVFTVKVKDEDFAALTDMQTAVIDAGVGLPTHDAEAWGEVFVLAAREYLGAGAEQPAEQPAEPAPV